MTTLTELVTRRGWHIVGVVVAVILLPWGTIQTVSTLAHEEESATLRFDASGLRVVEIHNDAGGAVRVVGAAAEADQVTVRANISEGLRATGHSEAIDGEKLVVRSSCPFLSTFCEVDYEVEVPDGIDVAIWSPAGVSVDGVTGDVSVRAEESVDLARLGGELRAHSSYGSVRARDLRSSDVDVSSSDGSISLQFSDSPKAVRADTTDGDIEVVVPNDGLAYRVSSSTGDGEITTEISTDVEGDRTITTDTADGDTALRYASG